MSTFEYEVGDTYLSTGEQAKTHAQRRRGLSRCELSRAPASLEIPHCRSIHTFGMRFDLCVIFLDRNSKVLEKKVVKPRRIVFGPKGTWGVVEIPVRN